MDMQNRLRQFFEKIRPKSVVATRSHEVRTALHWKIVITSFFIALLLLFIGSFFLYKNVGLGDVIFNSQSSPKRLHNKTSELLTKTIDFFKAQEALFKEFRYTSAFSSDPSR